MLEWSISEQKTVPFILFSVYNLTPLLVSWEQNGFEVAYEGNMMMDNTGMLIMKRTKYVILISDPNQLRDVFKQALVTIHQILTDGASRN